MAKKGIAFLISCAMMFSFYAPLVVKATAEATIVLKLNNAQAKVGEKAHLLQSPPVLVDNVTMVPLRFIGDALGAITGWNEETQSVTMANGGTTVELSIGLKEARVNNQLVELEQPAAIMNEATMVPLRFIAEALGQTVTFNQELQTITLSKKAAANTANSASQNLSQPTVDNLVADPEGGKAIPYPTRLIDISVDKNGSIYMLQKDPNTGYLVKMVEPETGRTNTVFQIDAKLNFQYDNINSNNDFNRGAITKKSYIYSEFHPTKLYYSRDLDQLYVLGGGIAYSLKPEVKLATHPFTLRAMLPHGVDYYRAQLGQDFFSSMFETVDGEIFYLEGDRSIYSSRKGGGTEFITRTYRESHVELVSTMKDKSVYTYEMSTGVISLLTDASLKPVTEAPVKGALNCIGENGNFYVMTTDKIHRITVDGKITTLLDTQKLTLNKGLYKGKGKEYEPIQVAEPTGVSFYTYTRFTVDEKDNVYFIDTSSKMIRRINISQN